FADERTLLKSIPSRISEIDCDPENEIRLIERFLYDNSSPRPLEEFVADNSDTEIESFSPSPIPPSAECPVMICGKNTPILDVPLFHFYPPGSVQV
nr:hypothetical protein [Tanacetum cinerariifolium]